MPGSDSNTHNTNHSSSKSFLTRLMVAFVIIGLTQLLAFCGGDFTPSLVRPLTIMQLTAFIAVGINLIAFIPAYIFQTEKFYDLIGSITYLSCVVVSYGLAIAETKVIDAVSTIASILTVVWALRLGSFLFFRVLSSGGDGRFDHIKPNFAYFFLVWMIQALWCTLTALPVYYLNSSQGLRAGDSMFDQSTVKVVFEFLGMGIWALGFLCEIIADHQKNQFRMNPENKGKFIQSGLWYYSRHPNYFGEIFLWFGMYILCAPTFVNAQWVASISPIFVYCLINFVSVVKLLEKRGDEKWGTDPRYQHYKKTTNVLIPWFKCGVTDDLQGSPSQSERLAPTNHEQA